MALYRRRAGQYRLAVILYRGILQRNPRDRHALHCLVFCLDRMGAHTAALQLIVKGNASLPPSAEGFLIEATMHLRVKKREKALDVLRTAGTSFPRDRRIPEKVAEIYRRDGITQLAVQYEQQAEKLKKS
jgi:tetratricopeptide (TPR) repeat protein